MTYLQTPLNPSQTRISILHNFFNAYWRGETDFTEWHEGQVIPVTKSRDISDPKKWRGVTLMDMGSKILSSILCTRIFRIIDKHGVKYQFGSTPGVVCQDGSLQLKQCYISGATIIYQLGYYLQISARRLTPLTMPSWTNYWKNTVVRRPYVLQSQECTRIAG